MVALEMDLTSGHIEYANAGHPPVILIGSDDHVYCLESKNYPVLGILTDPITSQTLREEKGQILVLYTDGLFELPTASGMQLGLEPLGEHLRSMCTAAKGHSCKMEQGQEQEQKLFKAAL